MDILLKPITIPQILTNSTQLSQETNSTQLLQEIETITIPENTILASLHVSSLYTNILIDEAIEIALEYLKKEAPLQALLNFILKCNCFTFS